MMEIDISINRDDPIRRIRCVNTGETEHHEFGEYECTLTRYDVTYEDLEADETYETFVWHDRSEGAVGLATTATHAVYAETEVLSGDEDDTDPTGGHDE